MSTPQDVLEELPLGAWPCDRARPARAPARRNLHEEGAEMLPIPTGRLKGLLKAVPCNWDVPKTPLRVLKSLQGPTELNKATTLQVRFVSATGCR